MLTLTLLGTQQSAQSEMVLSPVIESKFLYRSLQFSDLTLVERINSSEHHRLGWLDGHQRLHLFVPGVKGVANLGFSRGLKLCMI